MLKLYKEYFQKEHRLYILNEIRLLHIQKYTVDIQYKYCCPHVNKIIKVVEYGSPLSHNAQNRYQVARKGLRMPGTNSLVWIDARNQLLGLDGSSGATSWFGWMPGTNSWVWMDPRNQLLGLDGCSEPTTRFVWMDAYVLPLGLDECPGPTPSFECSKRSLSILIFF